MAEENNKTSQELANRPTPRSAGRGITSDDTVWWPKTISVIVPHSECSLVFSAPR